MWQIFVAPRMLPESGAPCAPHVMLPLGSANPSSLFNGEWTPGNQSLLDEIAVAALRSWTKEAGTARVDSEMASAEQKSTCVHLGLAAGLHWHLIR